MSRHVIVLPVVLGVLLVVCSVGYSNPGPLNPETWEFPPNLGGCGLTAYEVGPEAPAGIARPVYASGFAPGARVVLLDDDPAGATGLRAGTAGTIICCDSADCSGALLVSWDLWTGGQDEESNCVTPPVGQYPPGSATWVDPAKVRLGLVFDTVGTLVESLDGCLYLEADEGGVYNLVDAAEFQQAWWFVRPGNHVRVRALLNTSTPDPSVSKLCPQSDGDLYHPIMTESYRTITPCTDMGTCAFQYGDRVVLISEDNPYGAVDLPRGASGTVMCANPGNERSVLVSWNLWANGVDDDTYLECGEQLAGLFPSHSTWWVSLDDIARCYESECGTLSEVALSQDGQAQDFSAIGLFAENHEIYYLPDAALKAGPGGRFKAMGLRTPYGDLQGWQIVTPDNPTPQDLDGTIMHSVLIACPEPSYCDAAYEPGDRVRLLVDNPGGAEGLLAGTMGRVVCCNPLDPLAPIFVTWSDWANGNNDDTPCESWPGWYPDDSGWWMTCNEIGPLTLANLYDVGPKYRSLAPETIVAGEAKQPFEIAGMIGNKGGADSGAIFVDLYASLDDRITTADYYIGRVGMDLNPGGSIALSWKGSFPVDVPAGLYHVGWLIDPENRTPEVSEKDNMAVVEGSQVTVTGEVPGILYVDADATGANDGSSWTDAYASLQEALGVATSGWEIRVAQGVYKPDTGKDRAASFALVNHVAVYGGYAGAGEADPDARDIEANVTVLSGDLNDDDADAATADNSYHVVTATDVNPSAVLDGFTITGGNASDPWTDVPEGTESFGGGVFIKSGCPMIANCVLTGNAALYGAAAYSYDGGPAFINCRFLDNAAGTTGGAARFAFSRPLMINCRFEGNTAVAGGALFNLSSKTTLANCAFSNNQATGNGGAIANDCEIGLLQLTNCTLSGNSADALGGGLYNYEETAALVNSIVWGNTDSTGADETAQISGTAVTLDYCCVQGWTGALAGTGNIGDDPLLADGLALSAGSPCIDAGDNYAVLIDLLDFDGDGNFDEALSVDLGGAPRHADDASVADTGNGTAPLVDMGAYEVQSDKK